MSTPQVELKTLMSMLSQVKRIDMQVSMDVAGLANSAVRDHNGNLLPFVWTRQSIHNEHENASLLTRDALQKQMMNFIDSTASDNLKMLQKVSDPALLVDWVVRTAEHWERRYAQKRDEKYDISQFVLAVMLETITEQVLPIFELFCKTDLQTLQSDLQRQFDSLSKNPAENPYYMHLLQYVSAEKQSPQQQNLESFFWLHRGHHAIVRFFFRIGLQLYNSRDSQPSLMQEPNPAKRQKLGNAIGAVETTGSYLPQFLQHISIMAGKLLQKKEVCNKAGSYSSNRQRSDVLQEYNNAVLNFRMWVQNIRTILLFQELSALLQSDTWLFYVIDHTSIPVTLSHIQTVQPNLDLPESVVCPHCNASFVQRAGDPPDSLHNT